MAGLVRYDSELRIGVIKSPPAPHGWLHRRLTGKQTITIYNKRGKVVAWVGGKYLPANGPFLWLTVGASLVAGVAGGVIGRWL